MILHQTTYDNVRNRMRTGGLLAFGGTEFTSEVIKEVTDSPVSHVGMVFSTYASGFKGGRVVQVIESTSLGDGFAGVQINRLSVHIKQYDGDIWWLPLNEKNQKRVEFYKQKFVRFLIDQVGKPYDAPQAIASAIDPLWEAEEDLTKLFCSELVSAAYKHIGIIPPSLNPSEQTPADVVRFNIYADTYYQLKGKAKEIR